MFSQVKVVVRNVFRKKRVDQDLDEEVRSYIELVTTEKVRGGMSPEDASRDARIEVEGVEQVKEKVRDIRMGFYVGSLMQDLRYGFRMLLKHRSSSFVIVITLALGIGACAAIFSVVNAVLIRSLLYEKPERLVYLYSPNAHFSLPAEAFPPRTADFFDLKRQNHSFANMTLFAQATYNVGINGRAERMGVAKVDEDFFKTLGCAPEIGRIFGTADERPGNARVTVISYGVWQGMFGGAENILGRTLRLDGEPYRVVGVMPEEFGFPHKSDIAYSNPHIEKTELWVPSALISEER